MADLILFENFVEDLATGVHNLSTGAFKVYLSNTIPLKATHKVKADLAEITQHNGYTAPISITPVGARSGGTYTLTGTKFTITASGGTVGPFRYLPLYNDTPTSPADPLVGYWDYGAAVTLADGETFDWLPNGSSTTGTVGSIA